MGYFQVRYDSGVVNYDRRGFTTLATGVVSCISEELYKISNLCIAAVHSD